MKKGFKQLILTRMPIREIVSGKQWLKITPLGETLPKKHHKMYSQNEK